MPLQAGVLLCGALSPNVPLGQSCATPATQKYPAGHTKGLGEPDCDSVPVALREGASEALAQRDVEGLPERVLVPLAQGDALAAREGEAEAEGEQLGGQAVWPGAGQAAGQGQGRGAARPAVGQKVPAGHTVHVALVAAPVAALAVPGGHSVALVEDSGQKEPGGQMTGAPLAQK